MSPATTDRILRASIILLCAALVFVIYSSLHETIVNAGDFAPNFSITADTGRTISPTNFGAKILILNFWASWCQPCVEETPSLDQLQRRFKDRGLVVLAVSVDKDLNLYRRFLARARVSFLTARDPEQTINSEYGTFKYPESYIIDQSGKVIEKIIGPKDWSSDEMVNNVQALL